MESMGIQDSLAQHPLVSCCEFDLGNGEGMAQVEAAVHVGIWKGAEPFRMFLQDLCLGQTLEFGGRRRVYFKDMLGSPLLLVFLFDGFELVTLPCLEMMIEKELILYGVVERTWTISIGFDGSVGLDILVEELRKDNVQGIDQGRGRRLRTEILVAVICAIDLILAPSQNLSKSESDSGRVTPRG